MKATKRLINALSSQERRMRGALRGMRKREDDDVISYSENSENMGGNMSTKEPQKPEQPQREGRPMGGRQEVRVGQEEQQGGSATWHRQVVNQATYVEVEKDFSTALRAGIDIKPAEYTPEEYHEAHFEQAQYREAAYEPGSFEQAAFQPAAFKQAEFRQAEFQQAEFKPAEFKNGEWHPATFKEAYFKPAAFRPAEFRQARFKAASYTPATFKQAEFRPAEFKQASFVPAQFTESRFTPAEYEPAQFAEAQYSPAEYRPAEFHEASYRPAEFRQAQYRPAQYHEASYRPAEFHDASYREARYNPARYTPGNYKPASYEPGSYRPSQFRPAEIQTNSPLRHADQVHIPVGRAESRPISHESWTASNGPSASTINDLNELLQLEAYEAEAYEQAANSVRDPAAKQRLSGLRDEHGRRYSALANAIRSAGAEPSSRQGTPRPQTRSLGDLVALEERAMETYSRISRDPSLNGWLTSELIPSQRRAMEDCRSLARSGS